MKAAILKWKCWLSAKCAAQPRSPGHSTAKLKQAGNYARKRRRNAKPRRTLKDFAKANRPSAIAANWAACVEKPSGLSQRQIQILDRFIHFSSVLEADRHRIHARIIERKPH